MEKETESYFDVTIGCSVIAEVCKLVGIYILSFLEKIINRTDYGLYRDDGQLI